MKHFTSILFLFCFVSAEAQTDTLKVKKNECECSSIISNDFKHSSSRERKVPKGSALLKGKALDQSTNKPIANTAVEFIWKSIVIAASCTDSTGEFMLINIPLVKGVLRSQKCGYKTISINTPEAANGKTVALDLIMIPKLQKKKR